MKVLNELEYAQHLLIHGFGKYMSFSDLFILAKYFRYLGKDEKEIEHELIRFCQIHEPGFNEIIFADRILFIVKQSAKKQLRLPKEVGVTQKELEIIRSIKNYRYEKVLFTLLVLGKYYRVSNPTSPVSGEQSEIKKNFYYVNDNLNNILRLAHTSQKKGENIFHQLFLLGLIDYNKKYGTYVIKFTDNIEQSETSIVIKDMNNIIEYYPLYCMGCGKILVRKGRNQKMCEDCWKDREKELWRENKRKQRNN